MIRCKDCKWWGKKSIDSCVLNNEGYEVDLPEHRTCEGKLIIYTYNDSNQLLEEGGAMYRDASGYFATFLTTGSFGCVLGETNE